MRRKTRVTLCCIALGGMLSMNVLPAQAAWCSHDICYTSYQCDKAYYYEEDGHYKEYGTVHICADCGHEEWEDLRYEWFEGHDLELYEIVGTSDGTLHFYYKCKTPGCDWIL